MNLNYFEVRNQALSFLGLCLMLYLVGFVMPLQCGVNTAHLAQDGVKAIYESPKLLFKKEPTMPTSPEAVETEISSFRPFVQDIVRSYYKYPKQLNFSYGRWNGNNFSFRVSAVEPYDFFMLEEPKFDNFKNYPEEKKYLWNIYNGWRPAPEK